MIALALILGGALALILWITLDEWRGSWARKPLPPAPVVPKIPGFDSSRVDAGNVFNGDTRANAFADQFGPRQRNDPESHLARKERAKSKRVAAVGARKRAAPKAVRKRKGGG